MCVVLKVSCQDFVSPSSLQDMTNSVIEISEVGVQQPGWRLSLHLYVCQHVQVLGNGSTRYLLTQHWANLKSRSWGRLPKQTEMLMLLKQSGRRVLYQLKRTRLTTDRHRSMVQSWNTLESHLVSWCFESSQSQGFISGLKTNFNPSLG